MAMSSGRALGLLSVLLLGATLPAAAQEARPQPVPVPKVAAVPITATSYPQLSASRQMEPIALDRHGFTEEEFFVSGTANVYDWAASGDVTVKTADAPYTTRLLVRRPTEPARFSGNVIVEILHAPRGYDWMLMWSYSYTHFLERGDAWVGVTMTPDAIEALKTYDAARYAPLSFANPNPGETCAAGDAAPGTSPGEEGLRWDMISQVAALLKSSAPGRPLEGFRVEYVYQTAQDNAQLTYINAIHNRARLASGKPAYDGYVVKSGRLPARIRRCAAAPRPGDPRQVTRNVDVPVINLQQEGDVVAALSARREDSDAPADRYRLYEIAGVAHIDSAVYRWGIPTIAEMQKAGDDVSGYTREWPFARGARCEPEIPLTEQPILGWVTNGAFASLDRWVRTGTPAPRAPRSQVTGAGAGARIAVDRFGNGLGGLRTPHVEVPSATYRTNHQGPLGTCRNFGSVRPLTWKQLDEEYGGYEGYARRVRQAVDRFVADRWVTAADGERIKTELLGVAPGAVTRK